MKYLDLIKFLVKISSANIDKTSATQYSTFYSIFSALHFATPTKYKFPYIVGKFRGNPLPYHLPGSNCDKAKTSSLSFGGFIKLSTISAQIQ